MIHYSLIEKFMGLFDDLLGGGSKKEEAIVTPVQTVEPAQAVPQGTTVTSAAIDDMLNMASGNINPDMPSYTAQKEQESSPSPVIVAETTPMESVFPIISEVSPTVETASAPIVTEVPVTAEVTPSPIAVENSPIVAEVSPVTEVASSPIVSEATGVISENNVSENVPVVAEVSTEATSPVVENAVSAQTGQNDLFGAPSTNALFVDAHENSSESTQSAVEVPSVTESVSSHDGATNGLFGQLSTEESASNAGEIPENTEGFLHAGLQQLAKMKASLDDRRAKFLAESEQYRAEKEKFASLEEKAIADANAMEDEKKRIDSMEKYFTKQLEGPNINDSVHTALTGIGVKNAVDKTIEKKTPRTRKTAVHA